ncbi:transposase [Paracoccus litorisediminis]|uniref:Transposase n=3 Tax=Paracoccus litorisediminis TaxID=2006130 RepID=A0A844HIA3_9RHOB|nr:transposase [Paracoccus litorisediminis]
MAKYGTPEIFNSDQGSQFTGTAFTEALLDAKVRISMDDRSRWIDNRMIERQWRSLNRRSAQRNTNASIWTPSRPARRSAMKMAVWISYYNETRPHSSRGLLTPAKAQDTLDQLLKAVT